MSRLGLYAFPRHRDLIPEITRIQPSVVKAFASVTSNDWWKRVHEVSPGSILVLVHGEISDNPDLSMPETDADATAAYLADKPNCPRTVICKNEYPVWNGAGTRALWSDYIVRWLRRMHQHGLNGVVGEFNSGWPKVSLLDAEDWWPEFAAVEAEMNAGDYWGLHEYWGKAGPATWWPWTAGRHLRCPTTHNILIDECGFDGNTDGLGYNQGWAGVVTADQYVDQIITFHRMLEADPRVKGTAWFLVDYDNNHWAPFDGWPLLDRIIARLPECDAPLPQVVMPSRLHLPVGAYGYISQTFAQHQANNPKGGWGLDFSCNMRTPVLAAADGVVDKVQDDGRDGYGKHYIINHWSASGLYAHLDATPLKKGDFIQVGEPIGYSGNTGHSTGAHLHFEWRPYLGNYKWPYRVDPAPYLFGTGDGDVTNTQFARAKRELERVAFLDKVAKLHNLIWCGFEYTEDGQTVTLGQKMGTLEYYRVAVTTGDWTEAAARAAVPELVK